MLSLPILSAQIALPMLGGVGVLMFHRPHQVAMARWLVTLIALLGCGLAAWMYLHFDASQPGLQMREQHAWIPTLGLHYDVGVDGLSMPLIVLTAFTHLIIALSSWSLVKEKVHQYLAAFLFMQAMVVGVFCALDGILYYLFWEGMLIPMYLCIGIWGSAQRQFAATKFFLYTFFASALMLLAIIYCGQQAGSYDIIRWSHLSNTMPIQVALLVAFVLAFAVKVPMWPVHTWLPDAHTEAPAGGSVILAALMLKVGAYGFYRFCLPITPDAAAAAAPTMLLLSMIAIVSIGLIAWVQTDMKRLIAYSSVAHMGFVTLGCFAIYPIMGQQANQPYALMALEGGWVQMIAHAFGSGAMFLAFGLLYEQCHTRLIKNFGGLASVMPVFSAFFVLFALTNVGLPGTAGFVGEFMVLLAVFKAHWWLTALAGLSLIIAATYTLGMIRSVFYGPVQHELVSSLKDIPGRDRWVLALLACGIFAIGLFPQTLTQPMHATAQHLLQQALHSNLI